MIASQNSAVRFLSLVAKAAQTLFRDPRKALFLVRRRLWPIAYPIVRRFEMDDPPGQGVFVDCGSNHGEGVEYFRALYPPDRFDYVLFEPNPACLTSLERVAESLRSSGAKVTILQQAVWDVDETLTLSIPPSEDDPTALGSSLVLHNEESFETVEVEAIDIAPVLEKLYQEYGHMVLKMDIEGAELKVIPRVFGIANHIRHRLVFYVEFHSYYQEGKQKRDSLAAERELIRTLPEKIIFREWH